MRPAWFGLLLSWFAACSGQTEAVGHTTSIESSSFSALDHARFIWVSAQCVDGVLELAKAGFERTLTSEVQGNGLRFTYDTRVAQPDCVSTEIWSLRAEQAGQWQFTPEAQVSLPPEVACGAAADTVGHGVIQLAGDTLEELRFNSGWCRGFDARFVYRRVASAAPTRDEIIRRYAAHWNRRDARALAGLFAQNGLLIEPFTRSVDGAPVRHEGRADIEAWFSRAFASTPWLALQLGRIEPLDENGQVLAVWRYADARLAEPLAGRNLFLLAGGEIFSSELQLLADPAPRAVAMRVATDTP
jgi:hypothetical protein